MTFKKRFLFPVMFFISVLIASIAGYFWWNINSKPVSRNQDFVRILITKGLDAQDIGQLLYENKLIKNPLAFKVYVQLFGKAKNIQAGEFKIATNLTLPQVINELSKKPLEIWVTIPEGLRREEIPDIFIKNFELNSEQAENFRSKFLDQTKGKEGYLFPDTYLFSRTAPVELIVTKILDNFEKKFGAVKKNLTSEKYTSEDIVILASIIERETKTDEERPIVAGIFYKRLNIGMALQADATVQYAIANTKCLLSSTCDDWWPILLKEDMEINSKFNTYKFAGLPPSPIANPGLSSLNAAVFPQDLGYLYYLHDSGGQIHFAKDLNEHNFNIKKYLGK